jgi:predicted RNA-binding protein Jag
MKSIIEEASSIVKAIEAAWIRAEKPQEFSVKIFEEPEKNFFGMVTKSAKIALIFNHVEKRQPKDVGSKHKPSTESTLFNTQTKEYRKEQPRRETAPRESREDREYQDRREPRERREPRDRQDRQETREPREQREPRERHERQDTREPRERYERREPREPREQREPRERYEAREPREQREPREPRDRYESREPREQERRELREPMVRELTRKESTPKPAHIREQEQLSFVSHEGTAPGEQQQTAPEKIFWNEEMIATTHAWIETLLKNMDCGDISFTLEPKRYYLTITFDKPVRATKALEQQLFRSCAYLIMQMLRTKMKKQFRGLKVVLSSPTPS